MFVENEPNSDEIEIKLNKIFNQLWIDRNHYEKDKSKKNRRKRNKIEIFWKKIIKKNKTWNKYF